jgi:hypothetical protein
MRVPHYAKHTLAVLALATLMAGCGGDSTAPDAPFDPAGTSSDLGAMEASFDSPAMAGFGSAAAAISSVLGESSAAAAVRAVPTKALVTRGRPGARHYAATVAEAYVRPTGGMRPVAGSAAILEEHLGVTFTYNAETDTYEASELTGAPDDGVRFIVYAVNAITGVPVEPLVEVGYADITASETASSASVRIVLVSAGVTYLDYSIGATGSESAATVSISGFVTNGDDRVNFDLDNQINFDDELAIESVTLDYTLIVPTRGGFRIDFETEATQATATSTLEARGPHGTVTITGNQTSTTGSFEVEVNGELFATVTTTGSETVITGADGEALTEQELETLGDLLDIFVNGFAFFIGLLDPLP